MEKHIVEIKTMAKDAEKNSERKTVSLWSQKGHFYSTVSLTVDTNEFTGGLLGSGGLYSTLH